jgi:hypothetical protein
MSRVLTRVEYFLSQYVLTYVIMLSVHTYAPILHTSIGAHHHYGTTC